jgi:hypothetical protein
MNNSSSSSHVVPGFDGLSIYHELDISRCFNDGATGWRQSPPLTARELAMITLIELITDTDEWDVDVFDDGKVANWRGEAIVAGPTFTVEQELLEGWGEKRVLAMELTSNKAWNWCIMELRDKATLLQTQGYVLVADAGSCVCKSDIVISPALAEELNQAVVPLRESYGEKGRDVQITELVDPSMFPLVFGRTQLYTDGTQVERESFATSYSDVLTRLASLHQGGRFPSEQLTKNMELYGNAFAGERTAELWSLRFQ